MSYLITGVKVLLGMFLFGMACLGFAVVWADLASKWPTRIHKMPPRAMWVLPQDEVVRVCEQDFVNEFTSDAVEREAQPFDQDVAFDCSDWELRFSQPWDRRVQ